LRNVILGSRADSVSDLDGYRIEAIDIIMAVGVFRSFDAPEKTVCNILNQAFDLCLKPIDCVVPVRRRSSLLLERADIWVPRSEEKVFI
jgi:hypothetical protein